MTDKSISHPNALPMFRRRPGTTAGAPSDIFNAKPTPSSSESAPWHRQKKLVVTDHAADQQPAPRLKKHISPKPSGTDADGVAHAVRRHIDPAAILSEKPGVVVDNHIHAGGKRTFACRGAQSDSDFWSKPLRTDKKYTTVTKQDTAKAIVSATEWCSPSSNGADKRHRKQLPQSVQFQRTYLFTPYVPPPPKIAAAPAPWATFD